MDSNNPQNHQNCPVCGVSIAEDGQVNFSHGSSGTRARLYARVCQYTQKPGCINQESQLRGELNPEDGFESGENLPIPFLSTPGATN
ncbi:MAG: hypothetical protein QNJ53_12065 [Pleurocapsa sp. MO_192.B19]|nr:hypothetical protein [Pleurocapsa sp. MO_192.B19]